jgi:NAD(P)-dependent dehydrogenase (short-subunit alcohol dehydrogenase family)
MGKQLLGRVAIVTGASSGIGRGIAEVFASEGAKMVLVARRAELLEEVAAGIKAKGGQALALPADLTKETEIVELFRKSVQTYGRLDVLVNNAGIATHRNTEDISIIIGTTLSP